MSGIKAPLLDTLLICTLSVGNGQIAKYGMMVLSQNELSVLIVATTLLSILTAIRISRED